MQKLETITSHQNPKIKALAKLSQKKYRNQSGEFMIENLTIIYDALCAGHDFMSLFVTQDFIDKHQEKFEYLVSHSKCEKFYLIDEKINKHYSELDTPSGITAVFPVREMELVPDRSVVYLNGVSDPGNVGTIMRTALAFGFTNMIVDETCADIYNSKTLSAAKDAIFKLNVIEDKNGEWLKQNTLSIYAADSNQGVALSEFTPEEKFCLVLGSESHGVSDDILKIAKASVKIEMSGQMESLNVAVAAGVLMYEFSKK